MIVFNKWLDIIADHTIISYIGWIISEGILRRGGKKKETIFGSILGRKRSTFFNPSLHIISGTILPIQREGETDVDQLPEKYVKRLINFVCIRTIQVFNCSSTLHPKIRVSKLGFFSLVYTPSNCIQLDKGFYPNLNNIANVSVNLKVFVFFHGVWFH